MTKNYNIAIVGATGNTGMSTIQILGDRNFPIKNIVAIASDQSVGKELSFKDETIKVKRFSDVNFSEIDLAFFCAGGAFSQKNAKTVTDAGCTIIDKTSYFRLNPKVPLIIPEVNMTALKKGAPIGIVSTPNCVAVPLAIALKALSEIVSIKRVVISTYQSVSGYGKKAINELYAQTKSLIATGGVQNEVFPKQIAFNAIPQIGSIYENGVTDEEDKISCEIRKILKSDVKVAVTCVRVPTFIGHGISVACEFSQSVTEKDLYDAFNNQEGIVVVDRRDEAGGFVTPIESQGEDAVYVSRIRTDTSVKHGALFWIVSDNLRKGAALNSVQIAENMIKISPELELFKACKI